MKTKILYITLGLFFMLSSCELLNFDGPDAQFHGAIIDEETGDTIRQDIIDGSVIDYIEQGFEKPETQRLIFRVDGTFRNDYIFASDYKMIPIRGNFYSPDTLEIHLNKGDNKHDFLVKPYARIKNVTFEIAKMSGRDYLVARFNIDQVAPEHIKSTMIAMDRSPNVGLRLNEKFFGRRIAKDVGPDDEQVLWMRLKDFTEGVEYYIRVGALVDIPEAKYNWSKAVKLDPHTLPMP